MSPAIAAEPDTAGETAPVARLPRPVQRVLTAASAWIAAAAAESGAAAAGPVDVGGTRDLIRLLADSGPLRAILDHETGADRDDPDDEAGSVLAAALLHPDDAVAARAAARVEALLSEAVTELGKQRRQVRRAGRGTAEERAASRAEELVADLRRTRDTERAKREAAQAEAVALRDQLAEARAGLEDAQGRLQAATRQLQQARDRMRDPRLLAGLLADALDPDPVRDPGQPDADAGTPPDLPDGMPREDLVAALRRLAAPPVTTSDRDLRIEVLGGGTEIGGSCVLITAADTRILVDCGARPQGSTAETMAPRGYAQALAGPIDAVVVTHAHNDHAGWVPALLKARPQVAVHATRPTCDLLYTMWRDSAKVLARNGVDAFDLGDVDRACDRLVETPLGRPVAIGDLTVELFAAGHIIGAAGVVVTAGDRRVVVTGDVSAAGQETVGGFSPCGSAQGADLMLLESTYAGAGHTVEPRSKVVGEFLRTVERTVERGGVALVPAFALGRAQEVALLCAKYLPGVPVLIDGLAREVTDVYEQHLGGEGVRGRIFSDQVRKVPVGGTRDAARRFRAGVVVTTSGMLTQGPAITWAQRVLPDPDSALMVVGYQDEESPGRRLLRLADAGGGVFDLPGRDGGSEPVEVFASVGRYQLGAHANADELAQIVTQTRPSQVMLVHGEADGQARFATRLRQRAHAVTPTGLWTPAP